MDKEGATFFEDRIVFRIASPLDADAVSILLKTSYSYLLTNSYESDMLERAFPYMDHANSKLLASGTYYVAELEPGVCVGCGGWTSEEPGTIEAVEGEAHIRHFAVHPDWTKRRIGTALLNRCIADAKSIGIHKLHCISTLNAEAFYRASGFQTIGLVDVQMAPTIAFPAVLMWREI